MFILSSTNTINPCTTVSPEFPTRCHSNSCRSRSSISILTARLPVTRPQVLSCSAPPQPLVALWAAFPVDPDCRQGCLKFLPLSGFFKCRRIPSFSGLFRRRSHGHRRTAVLGVESFSSRLPSGPSPSMRTAESPVSALKLGMLVVFVRFRRYRELCFPSAPSFGQRSGYHCVGFFPLGLPACSFND